MSKKNQAIFFRKKEILPRSLDIADKRSKSTQNFHLLIWFGLSYTKI